MSERKLTIETLLEAKELLDNQEIELDAIVREFRCGSTAVFERLMNQLDEPTFLKDGRFLGAKVVVDAEVPDDEIHGFNLHGRLISILILKEETNGRTENN